MWFVWFRGERHGPFPGEYWVRVFCETRPDARVEYVEPPGIPDCESCGG